MEKGTLVRWNAEKGFGFIKPDATNNQDVFIHISALKQMARKPVVGDQINYFSEQQSDGKIKAIKANIEGVAIVAASPNRRDNKRNGQYNSQYKRKSSSGLLLPLLVVLGLGIFGFKKYEELTATPVLTNQDVESIEWQPPAQQSNSFANKPQFKCDGKTHCSQMRSCAEAKFYNSNCPGTKMDGDHDGIPCERQWCN
ncbi:excalibur calcium-binding domain-containing protein [Shewanella colwelliana]|uniref:excalibur calcium-binding domain-containing protein n=1 Tax=Shewanella colwelliana TaxID=23 RepID=UPI003735A970